MIAGLRRRHRAMILLLIIPILAVFVLGLSVRKGIPAVAEFPQTGTYSPTGQSSVLEQRNDLFPELPIDVRLRRQTEGGSLFFEFEIKANLKKPDLLVYWVPGTGQADGVPAGATLLGSLGGTGAYWFPLPRSAGEKDGGLLIYSLAHQSRVALADFPIATAVSRGGNP